MRALVALVAVAAIACVDAPSRTHPAPVPAINLGLSTNGLSVNQGQSATVTLTLTRSGGFAGPVQLSADPVPNGVTIAFAGPTIAANATISRITVSAASSVAVESFTLTVRGHASGVSDATASIPVTIVGRATNVTLAFCPADFPTWVATQDDQGAWVRTLPDPDNVFRVAIGARGGVAVVHDGTFLDVTYATPRELNAYFQCDNGIPVGPKTIHGTVSGGTLNTVVNVALGESRLEMPPGTNEFTLHSVPASPLDLLATHDTISFKHDVPSRVMRMIIQRNLNLANEAHLDLDFNGQTAVQPAVGKLTINGLSSAGSSVYAAFQSANGSAATTYQLDSGGTVHNYLGLPPAFTAVGDLHMLRIDDAESTPLAPSTRFVTLYFRDVADRTVTMGPSVGRPTLSPLPGGNAPRWRVQLQAQPEYESFVEVALFQPTPGVNRVAALRMTADYLGTGAPQTWDLSMPDLTDAGFNPVWGFTTNDAPLWIASAGGGGTLEQLFSPVEGQVMLGSMRFADQASTTAARSAMLSRARLSARVQPRRVRAFPRAPAR